jgi:hypothetical protein
LTHVERAGAVAAPPATEYVDAAPAIAVAGLVGACAEPPAETEARPVVDVLRRSPASAPPPPVHDHRIAPHRVAALRQLTDRQTIRRDTKQLTSKQVLAGLRKIPIVEQKLGVEMAQGMTGLEHVRRALKAFDKHLAFKSASYKFVNEAIRIATVIDATAAELARAIHDPTLKWEIAKELIAAYRGELQQALGSVKNSDRGAQTTKALDLAEVVVSGDPVTLFMTDKVKLEDAAWRIREMAVKAKVEPLEMMRILRRRFEMEMGSYSQSEVAKGQRNKDTITQTDANTGAETTGEAGFDLADLIGEISPAFYGMLVPAKTKPKDKEKLPKWASDGLAMNKKATDKLAELEKAVISSDLKETSLSPSELAAEQKKSGSQLNEKQSEHFARLRGEEAADANDYEGKGKSPREYVVDQFVARYALKRSAADSLVGEVLQSLATVPLTLSSKIENLFKERDDKGDDPYYGSEYKSEPSLMQKEVDIGTLVGKPDRDSKAMSIGQPDDEFKRTRGDNYMRWRRDKDERETGFHGLGADDLPVFAAVNPNFHATKGGNANLAEFNPKTGEYGGVTYGENYYGDMHMLLKDSVRKRSTLIARGKKFVEGRRIERTDLTFLLADMCRLFMFDYIDAMVAALKKPDIIVLTNMDAEVHVYGGLDIAKDVQAFYLSSAAMRATSGPGKRCNEFAKKHGIDVRDIGSKPATYNLAGMLGTTGGIDLKGILNP